MEFPSDGGGGVSIVEAATRGGAVELCWSTLLISAATDGGGTRCRGGGGEMLTNVDGKSTINAMPTIEMSKTATPSIFSCDEYCLLAAV